MKIRHSFSLLLFGTPLSLIRALVSPIAHRHMQSWSEEPTLTLLETASSSSTNLELDTCEQPHGIISTLNLGLVFVHKFLSSNPYIFQPLPAPLHA